MMKAIIYPVLNGCSLDAIRQMVPDQLIPLAGKPLIEHQIERIVECGISDIEIISEDRPDVIARQVGNGERWGCVLKITSVRNDLGIKRVILTSLYGLTNPVLFIPANLVPTPELNRFIEAVSNTSESIHFSKLAHGAGLFASNASYLIESVKQIEFWNITEFIQTCITSGVTVSHHDIEINVIQSSADILQLQRSFLEECIPGIRIPARKVTDGVWIGSHSQLPDSVILIPPVFIGSYCRIIGRGQIGPNTSIGINCLINNSDLVTDSIIMPGTATGPHTELNGVMARGNQLLNLHNGMCVNSPDAFILGWALNSKSSPLTGQILNSLTAAVLIMLLLPFAVTLFILSLIFSDLKRDISIEGNTRTKMLRGDDLTECVRLQEFTTGPLMLRRWPGLFSVLSGKLRLIGALRAASNSLPQSDIDMDVPRGLIAIWEVEGDVPESTDECIIRENYHAVTRTITGDLILTVRSLITPCRRKHVVSA